jgi:hypothetical protein
MYEWIKDPIRGWCFVPEWMADMCRAEPKGLGNWLREDAKAFSAQRRAMPTSFNVRPAAAAPAFTADDLMAKPKPSGWSEPTPLKSPPGVDLADRIVDAQDRRDRVDAVRAEVVRRKLK